MSIKFIDPHIEILSAPPRSMIVDLLGTAASNCYQSEPKDMGKLVKKIVDNGHHSVLEHAQVTFKITCDRAVSHEWVRHRIGTAYSQESQRYVRYNELEFIKPHWWNDPELTAAQAAMINACDIAAYQYKTLLSLGLKPEEARGILPNAVATRIVVSMNFRALLHFIELRGSKRAHPDIRFFAKELKEFFHVRYPEVF